MQLYRLHLPRIRYQHSRQGPAGRMPRLHRSATLALVGLVILTLHWAAQHQDTRRYASETWSAARTWRGGSLKDEQTEALGDLSSLEYAADVKMDIDARGLTAFDASARTHPISSLIERGRWQAAAQQARRRAVKSVEDSAADYRDAFGMAPPRGFEAWYVCLWSAQDADIPSIDTAAVC